MTNLLIRFCLTVLLCCAAASAFAVQADDNIIELSQRDTYLTYADCWGYYDSATDMEYAILATAQKVSIWNISDPFSPYETGSFFFFQEFPWRDVKVYNDYIYAVGRGQGNGFTIVDITDPENPVEVPRSGSFTAQNLWIDQATGVAYCAGWHPVLDGPSKLAPARGFLAYDLVSDPDDPDSILEYVTPYFRDVHVRGEKLYGAAYDEGGRFDIVRISDLPATSLMGSTTYPSGKSHNVWPSDDGDHLFVTDEILNTGTVRVFDVSDTASLFQVAQFPAFTGASAHNVIIENDTAYVSWYQEGLKIFDVTDPLSPVQIGSFDTAQDETTAVIGPYWGCYGVYPFLPSNVIVTTDIHQGMRLLYYADSTGTLAGTVTDLVTGLAIDAASVEINAFFGRLLFADGSGDYSQDLPGGDWEVVVKKSGYFPDTTTVTINDDIVTVHDVALVPTSSVGVENGVATPRLVLNAPSPNPFLSSTELSFELPRESAVSLTLFDTSGRRVRTLTSKRLPIGRHSVSWDGRDERGHSVASGAFVARLQAGGETRTTKLLLSR